MPTKINASAEVNKYIEIAYDISKDMDFIQMMDQEMPTRDPAGMSKCFYYNWKADCSRKTPPPGATMEQSKWFCQINKPSHYDLYTNPNFLDPHRQLNECYKLYLANPYQFYGYPNRSLSARNFVWNSYMANIRIGDMSDTNYIKLLKYLLD